MNNIYNEFLREGLNFDRVVTDIFKLPNDWKSIEIQPNELAVANTFNLKIKKLYENMLYLYGLCSISDFDIPKISTGVLGISTTKNDILSSRSVFVSGGNYFSGGNNDAGQLASGSENNAVYINMPIGLTFEKVALGKNFAYGLTANKLYAVGSNLYGQLGLSETATISSSTFIPITGSWKDIACGERHAIALDLNNIAYGVGENSLNQLGVPTSSVINSTFFPVVCAFNSVYCGPFCSFGLTGSKLFAAGNNSSGQFGDYNTTNYPMWRGLSGSWLKVAPGESHTIALGTNNKAYGAGSNIDGQIGLPTTGLGTVFFTSWFEPLTGVYSDISVGNNHSILLSSRDVYVAGLNDRGQLGNSSNDNVSPFQRLTGTYIKISAKNNNTYLLSTNDFNTNLVNYRLLATGDNSNGQLGVNSPDVFSSTYLTVTGNWFNVEAGYNYVYAQSANILTSTSTLSSLSAYRLKKFTYTPELKTLVPFISSLSAFGVNDSFDAVTFLPQNSEYISILLVLSKDYITLIGIDQFQIPNELGFFNLINPVSGTLFIENLKGGVTDGKKYFYFTDSVYNNVFYFDLEGFFSKRSFKNKQYLVETLAGFGGRYDNIKLNNPGQLAFTGSELIVEDTGNQAIKVYDRNLNWLGTTTPLTVFKEATSFNTMEFNSEQNKLYACSKNKMYVFDYKSNYTFTSSYSIDFTNLLNQNESIRKIKFSSYDSEIYFLVTDSKLIKRWTTKRDANIGIYLNSKQYNNYYFKWLALTPSENNTDSLYLYCNSANLSSNFIATFIDDYDLITSLKTKDITIYDIDDLYLNEEEYNSSWVYNKTFKKLMYNMALLNSFIIYRFVQNVDINNTPILIDRVYNDFFLENKTVDINKYAVIGINENFQAATLNRCLKLILNYQQNILDNVISNDNTTPNLSPGRPRRINPYNPILEQLNLGTEDLLSLLTEFGIYLINE